MDQIEQAIATADEPPSEDLRQVTVTIASTGRHVIIAFPGDMSDSEALEFVGWLGTKLRLALVEERARAAGPAIWVPPTVARAQ